MPKRSRLSSSNLRCARESCLAVTCHLRNISSGVSSSSAATSSTPEASVVSSIMDEKLLFWYTVIKLIEEIQITSHILFRISTLVNFVLWLLDFHHFMLSSWWHKYLSSCKEFTSCKCSSIGMFLGRCLAETAARDSL